MAKRPKEPIGWNEAVAEMDEVSDGLVLLLKGHLLIEEALYTLLSTKLPHPEFFLNSNPRFSQLFCVAKALFYNEEDKAAWDAIHALNRLRNNLAHNFDLADTEQDLHVLAFGKWRPKVNDLSDPDIMIAVSFSIGSILGSIEQMSTPEE